MAVQGEDAMSAFFGPGGSDPFDDLFARYFGAGAPRRPVQRVDITRDSQPESGITTISAIR